MLKSKAENRQSTQASYKYNTWIQNLEQQKLKSCELYHLWEAVGPKYTLVERKAAVYAGTVCTNNFTKTKQLVAKRELGMYWLKQPARQEFSKGRAGAHVVPFVSIWRGWGGGIVAEQ